MPSKPFAQVTTNLPSEMYQELRKQVTAKNSNMSQVLRSIVADSLLLKSGNQPKPGWAADLTNNIAALRQEIIDARQTRDTVLVDLIKQVAALRTEVRSAQTTSANHMGQDLESQLTKQLCDLKQEMLLLHERTQSTLDQVQVQVAPPPAPVKTSRWPVLIGRLTQVFQPKPAAATDDVLSAAS